LRIKKASPGLDQRNQLAKLLGTEHEVIEYDPATPLAKQVEGVHVLLVRDVPIDRAVIDSAESLKLIQRPGDHLPIIDLEYAKEKGIHVSRFPSKVQGAPARDVAEHAFHLILALAKESVRAHQNLLQGVVGLPKTRRLHGMTLGLVGVGNTGSELARLGRGFGMRVIAVKRTEDHALAAELGLSWLKTFDSLNELLTDSDVVSLHLPMIPETVDFLSDAQFARMKRGALLINISRAAMVNRGALESALDSGQIGGVGLDVFWEEPVPRDDPLLNLPNVVITPHIAGDTKETEQKLAELSAENIHRIARAEDPAYLVGVDIDPA
jgi:D-3-phosphoglycerate dehydrogenase / 2-oxoglutarate reductase